MDKQVKVTIRKSLLPKLEKIAKENRMLRGTLVNHILQRYLFKSPDDDKDDYYYW